MVGYGPWGGKESDMTEHEAAQGFGPQHVNFRGTQMFSPAFSALENGSQDNITGTQAYCNLKFFPFLLVM